MGGAELGYRCWQPQEFRRFERRIDTSCQPAVIRTDVGPAYVKCIGNREGEHALACEWIGARIADAMGLPTLDFAIFELSAEDVPFNGGRERPGPVFATRKEQGAPWDGTAATMASVVNVRDISKLVVLDNLLLNADRYNPTKRRTNYGNVFLSQEREVGRLTLLAMDHTHILCQSGGLRSDLGSLQHVRFEPICGLFSEFRGFIDGTSAGEAMAALGKITDSLIDQILGEIPKKWSLDSGTRSVVRTFLRDRRDYLAGHFLPKLSLEVGRQLMTDEEEK